MKLKNITLALFILMLCQMGLQAQFGPSVKSPEITNEGVVFRLEAPDASEVLIAIAGTRTPMARNEEGVWTATKELEPDIYEYSFVVDGLTINDPSNSKVSPAWVGRNNNMVVVPGTPPKIWEVKEGPYGTVHHHFYTSGLIGDHRDFFVYTPPDYDPERNEPYPVLYLFHGIRADARAWVEGGSANVILDNLINEGMAEPMIMVNTLGYGDPTNMANGESFDLFIQSVLKEVMPQVESKYNASAERENRAVAGLSMGGAQAIFAALKYPEYFSWAGGFSSAFVMYGARMGRGNQEPPDNSALFASRFPGIGKETSDQFNLFLITCGSSDFLLGINQEFSKWLTAQGLDHKYVETEGAHTFHVWRRNLIDFAPLLFK